MHNKPHTVSQVMWELMDDSQRASVIYHDLMHRLADRRNMFKPDGRTKKMSIEHPEPQPQLDNPNTWSLESLNSIVEYTQSPDEVAHRIHVCMLDTFFALMSVDDEMFRERALMSLSEALYLYEGKEFKGDLYE